MSDDTDRVWPTGLTMHEAEEVHRQMIDGTRIFGLLSILAHVLVGIYTPWFG